PRSGSCGGGPVEALEDVGQVLGWDAGAGVAHAQPAVPQRDRDVALGRSPGHRVVEQVDDGPVQGLLVPDDEGGFQVEGQRPRRGGAVARAGGDRLARPDEPAAGPRPWAWSHLRWAYPVRPGAPPAQTCRRSATSRSPEDRLKKQ